MKINIEKSQIWTPCGPLCPPFLYYWSDLTEIGSCLKTGQHLFCNFIFITAYKIYIFDSISKILFKFFMYKSQRYDLIMILIMEILLHNVYKPHLDRLTNLIPLFC